MAQRAAFVFASVALAGVAAQIVKHIIGRARPRLIDTLGPYYVTFLDFHASRNSFPSGHAANVFSAAIALALLWPRRRGWLIAGACIIGASRVLVHAHYTSDVFFGAILGVGTSFAVATVFAARKIAFTQVKGVLVPRGRRGVAALGRMGAQLLHGFTRPQQPR